MVSSISAEMGSIFSERWNTANYFADGLRSNFGPRFGECQSFLNHLYYINTKVFPNQSKFNKCLGNNINSNQVKF